MVAEEKGAVMVVPQGVDDQTLLAVVASGNCKQLTDGQKIQYYRMRCDAAGLDWRTFPLQFIEVKGKLVLYALKAATDQLSAKHGVKCAIMSQVTDNDIRTVTVRTITKDGRQTDEVGCVSVKGLVGEDLANKYMTAVTKAKRRAILSVCGTGMLDETEVETIKDAVHVALPQRMSETIPTVVPEAVQASAPAGPGPAERAFMAGPDAQFTDPADAPTGCDEEGVPEDDGLIPDEVIAARIERGEPLFPGGSPAAKKPAAPAPLPPTPPEAKTRRFKRHGKGVISRAQNGRMWALYHKAAEDRGLTQEGFDAILAQRGYDSSKDVEWGEDYEWVCNQLVPGSTSSNRKGGGK